LKIVGQAGMDRKTPSDHLHLIGYYRKTLEPRLSCRILFSDDVPKTIDGWMEKAIEFDTNWRMGNLFFNQDIKTIRCKKAGHMAKYCPPEQGESSKKKADLARFAYTTIKALTKEQRESFTKMVMEDKDGEDF
jgi:hypothetical protein